MCCNASFCFVQLISWKDLVAGSDKINKQESDQQEAIWELINTELSYYQRVRVLWEVFYVALTELQKEKFLTNVGFIPEYDLVLISVRPCSPAVGLVC